MRLFKNRPLYEKIILTLGIVLSSLFIFGNIYQFLSLGNAVVNNDANRIKFLLRLGYAADPPLRMAVANGNVEITDILIFHGANINTQDEYGHTLLDYAIIFNRTEVAKLLIEKGIQLNNHNLGEAASHGNREITDLLIKKGLNVNAPYWINEEDANLFNKSQRPDVPCACCPSPLNFAAYHNHSEVVELLLDHGADINDNGKDCFTPLHSAAAHRAEKTVKLLLSKGANVNAIDKEGHTPLYYATKNEDITVQQILISAGGIRK